MTAVQFVEKGKTHTDFDPLRTIAKNYGFSKKKKIIHILLYYQNQSVPFIKKISPPWSKRKNSNSNRKQISSISSQPNECDHMCAPFSGSDDMPFSASCPNKSRSLYTQITSKDRMQLEVILQKNSKQGPFSTRPSWAAWGLCQIKHMR